MSYTRHDEAIVQPLATLLGVAAEQAVFLDVDSLRPGDDWRREIETAIRQSRVFVLCWCCQAWSSDVIPIEIAIAFEDPNRRIVPVLLCDSQPPNPICHLHWINLQAGVRHECSHPPQQSPKWAVYEAGRPSAQGPAIELENPKTLGHPEVQENLDASEEQFFRLHFKLATGQLGGLKKYREVKKDRARMLAVLRDMETADKEADAIVRRVETYFREFRE